jgi:hypothetical protein
VPLCVASGSGKGVTQMEHTVVWFSFETVVIGGLLLAVVVFCLGMCCGHWLGRNEIKPAPAGSG